MVELKDEEGGRIALIMDKGELPLAVEALMRAGYGLTPPSGDGQPEAEAGEPEEPEAEAREPEEPEAEAGEPEEPEAEAEEPEEPEEPEAEEPEDFEAEDEEPQRRNPVRRRGSRARRLWPMQLPGAEPEEVEAREAQEGEEGQWLSSRTKKTAALP